MDRTQAERLITEHVKPIFGFALRRCACIQDAEDVTQEITLRAFQALLRRDDIADPVRYIWMIAHNVLANHYRDLSRMRCGISNLGMEETDFQSALIEQEEAARLRQEVSHLTRIQREIVVGYYFHRRKQAEIAEAMQLPVGTVKWHLFEAKKELKRNMEKTRNTENLSFDPIRFTAFGIEGSIGEEGSPWRLFRATLNQNIAYAVWREARTSAQIADALDVSPVYIEDAVKYMTEQGYLTEQHGKYRCTLLLTKVNDQLISLSDHMYREAAKLIAPALYKALLDSDIWSADGFYPGAGLTSDRFSTARKDTNFALWALIPWCIADSQPEKAIAFADVASLRPDGAHNIVHATLALPGTSRPALYNKMNGQFSGPCWNERGGMTLWQLDTCWSDRRIGEIYQQETQALLSALRRILDSEGLTKEEYAHLVQKGLLRISGDPESEFTAGLMPVWLRGHAIRENLHAITAEVYAQHHDRLEALKYPYAEALLADTPTPLRKLRQYMLQNTFQSDWFIMHCLHMLTDAELLSLPSPIERRALHTIILTA